MEYAGQRNGLPHTVLAHPPVAQKRRRWAQQAIVVEGLCDRSPLCMCRVVHCGRDEREEIMHIHHIRSILPDLTTNRTIIAWTLCRPRPGQCCCYTGDCGVIGNVLDHLVTVLTQEQILALARLVLASTLTVSIVYREDAHRPLPLAAPRSTVGSCMYCIHNDGYHHGQ